MKRYHVGVAIAALALAACPARLAPVVGNSSETAAAVHRTDAPAAIATIRPVGEDGMALLVVTVAWPERGRTVASIHPSTERLVFELKGPGQLPTLPELTRPGGGSLVKATSVKLPVVDGVEIRATAFAGTGAVVGLSAWTAVRLRRNTRVDVPVELLPASGPDQLTAVLLAPTIAGVSPDRGYPQQTDVTIRGTNFGFGQGFGAVKFGGQEAGQASQWTDSLLGGSTISIQVPPGAKTGPIQVRLGGNGSTQTVAWPSPGSTGGDPWSGHFTVLGPAGEPTGIDTGTMNNHNLAWDGSRFWIFWTKGGGSGMVLNAATLTPDSLTTVSSLALGTAVQVATAAGIQLGGFATDATGAWISWQETGSAVKMAHIMAGASAPDKLITLTNTPAPSAQPVLACAASGRILAAWIDYRDSIPGGAVKPRMYALSFAAGGLNPTTALPIQESNGPVGSKIALVGTPSVAVSQEYFQVGWQETETDTWYLMFQAVSFNGNRLFTKIGGWGEAGPFDTEFQNRSLTYSRRSLEDVRVVYDPLVQEFSAVYLNRLGSGTLSSDIYVHRLFLGEPAGEHIQVADDTRQQGRAKCPSFDPGTPCGQGFRSKPDVVWNGRDYMMAWQMTRDDGEMDILGARLKRDPQGMFLRAAEEPNSPRPSLTYPRSVAEIFYSFEPNRTGVSMPGAQTQPRLAWGADVMLVGWIEPKGDQSAVVVRLWR